MNQKGFANIALIVLVVVLASTAGYFVLRKPAAPPPEPLSSQAILPANQTPPATNNVITPKINLPSDSTVNWKTYHNTQYGFSFKYPPSATLSTPTGNAEVISHTAIEFEQASSFYNRAAVYFLVKKKGTELTPPPSSCTLYKPSTRVIGGKSADMLEFACGEASYSHLLRAMIPLSATLDLVYQANVGNSFISQNDYGLKILDTLVF